jgi:hypothetical protein
LILNKYLYFNGLEQIRAAIDAAQEGAALAQYKDT